MLSHIPTATARKSLIPQLLPQANPAPRTPSPEPVQLKPAPLKSKKTTTQEAIEALVMINPSLGILNVGKVVVRRDYNVFDGVKIVSGGGSGHEPAFAHYVGKGMLTAAIQGEIYKSPSSTEICNTLREMAIKQGSSIIVILQHESGVLMNFGLAIERAKNEGLNIHTVIVRDEAIFPTQKTRGLCGCVLLYKIAGAMSEKNIKIVEISNFLSAIQQIMFTMVIQVKNCITNTSAICSCTKGFTLGMKEGSSSGNKCPQITTEETCKALLDELKKIDVKLGLNVQPTSPIVLMINNLGMATKLEELLFTREILRQLHASGTPVARVYLGKFLTFLGVSGYSITVLKNANPKLLGFLDHPTDAPAWNNQTQELKMDLFTPLIPKIKQVKISPIKGPKLSNKSANTIQLVVQFACDALVSCERQLNTIDAESGDGDTGQSMKLGAQAMTKKIVQGKLTVNPYLMFTEFSKIVETVMGGTMGFLYSIFFESAAKTFGDMGELNNLNINDWINALANGNAAIGRYSDAKIGDFTMLDPLNSCAITMQVAVNNGATDLDAFYLGVTAAEDAAKLKPPGKKFPDPGAHAVGIWLRALYEGLKLRFSEAPR